SASQQEGNQDTPPPIIAASISKKPLFDSVEALGTAYANESVDITANATETISAIQFEDGQKVKKGDVVVLLEQQEEQAQLRGAKAQKGEHQRELERLKNLLKNKAAAKREYDERQTLLEVANQEVKGITAR